MAEINIIAKDWADELRGGIAWLIVWKTGRSWNIQAVWLSDDKDTFLYASFRGPPISNNQR